MPQVVERPGQDRDERADADERQPELGAKRTEHEGTAADGPTGHRGDGRDESREAPERHAGIDKKVRRTPEGVASEDPRSEHEGTAADGPTGHRGDGRDESREAPERHAGIDKKVRRTPEGVASEDP